MPLDDRVLQDSEESRTHYRVLMSWETDYLRGSKATRGPILYAMEKVREQLDSIEGVCVCVCVCVHACVHVRNEGDGKRPLVYVIANQHVGRQRKEKGLDCMGMYVYCMYVHYYYFDLITGVPLVCAYINYTNRSMDEQGKVHLDNMAAQSLTKSTKHLHRELTVWILYRICVYVTCLLPLLFVEKGKRKS